MAYDPGDVWTPQLTAKDANGALTDATVTLSVTSPTGVVSSPAVTHVSLGVYTATVPLTDPGTWLATWTVTGPLTGVESQTAQVRPLGSNVISVADVKARLNETITVDDDEIADMLDAALAEYEQYVGPLPGTRTEWFDGGGTALVLAASDVTAVTAAQYDDGTTITLTDLTVRNGIVRWGYGTAGRFTAGSQNVQIIYTVGGLPANHREVIIADVAGYFETTQRASVRQGPTYPGESEYDNAYTATPAVLFPRIRALASLTPKIA